MKRENKVWYVKFDEWIAFASLEDAIEALR
jgi:hypothetical protein